MWGLVDEKFSKSNFWGQKKINTVNFEVTSQPKDQFSPDAKKCVQFRGVANYIVRQREKKDKSESYNNSGAVTKWRHRMMSTEILGFIHFVFFSLKTDD